MADVEVIDKLEQLKKYLNKDNVIEIVVRDKKKRYKAFQKIALKDLPQNEVAEKVQEAINLLNKNNDLAAKNAKLLKGVANLGKLNIVLDGLNLCATCAGFAMMYAKLNELSAQIGEIIAEHKKGQQIQANYEYKKIISEHSNMLTRRMNEDFYSEEQMRELVDGEYTVLNLLIEIFLTDASLDYETLIISIFSLASMLALSLRYYDELYYNKYSKGNAEDFKWHMSHESWTGVFNTFSSPEFIEKIQDFCIFDQNLSTIDTDRYWYSLKEEVYDQILDVKDNQDLLLTFGDPDLMELYNQFITKEFETEAEAAFAQIVDMSENKEIRGIFDAAIQQVAMA